MEQQKDDESILIRVEQQRSDRTVFVGLMLLLATEVATWVSSFLNMSLALILSAVACAMVCILECEGILLSAMDRRRTRLLACLTAAQVIFLTLCYVFGW